MQASWIDFHLMLSAVGDVMEDVQKQMITKSQSYGKLRISVGQSIHLSSVIHWHS